MGPAIVVVGHDTTTAGRLALGRITGKKRESQREQAQKMIKMQGKDIANKGAAPGAVVTVQCDYRAVSHSIKIFSVIYEVSKFGGARIATIAGILLSGSRKGP